jgi:hypothetical protein
MTHKGCGANQEKKKRKKLCVVVKEGGNSTMASDRGDLGLITGDFV